jgi:hypothetical protein
MSQLTPRLLHFRDHKITGQWAVCANPYTADDWQGWLSVQPGDVILELDDTLTMAEFHMISAQQSMTLEDVQALTGGHVTEIPAAPAPDGHELMYRKRGRGAGELVARYQRKEDETDVALMQRRARGEQVPEIPADAVLPVALERRLEAVKAPRGA